MWPPLSNYSAFIQYHFTNHLGIRLSTNGIQYLIQLVKSNQSKSSIKLGASTNSIKVTSTTAFSKLQGKQICKDHQYLQELSNYGSHKVIHFYNATCIAA